MSRRERRSVSLGRQRERPPRDQPCIAEEDLSTRHNISNFLLALQRVQASEAENRQLRKENQLLRQRTRSSRLSSGSFKEVSTQRQRNTEDDNSATILPDAEDEAIEAQTKRNSLIFVGDVLPTSPDHAALESQHQRLKEDFDILKDFLKHLFQHALSIPSPPDLTACKDNKEKEFHDINTYNPTQSKQLERNLENIHGQIYQLRNSQDQQQVKMEQVQQALDNVLSQSSVRNDVTMRLVRQQDKMKEMTRHTTFLETQLMATTKSLRQAEEKLKQCTDVGQNINQYIASNSKNLKGNTKDDIKKMADQLCSLGQRTNTCSCKMSLVNRMISFVAAANQRGETLSESRPPAEVVDCLSKLERLVGSDWHRLGRMLGLNAECLEDIGKFTNFDLTSKVEKVLNNWVKTTRRVSADALRLALEKMDRDILLLAEHPLCKDWHQLPADVLTFAITHLVDVQQITQHLAIQGIIGPDAKAFILDAPQDHRRAGRLIQTSIYMGLQALCMLCATLERHNQSPVALKIRGCLPSNCLPNVQRNEDTTTEEVWTPRSKTNTLSNRSSPMDTMNTSSVSSSSNSSASVSRTSTLTSPSKTTEKKKKKRSRSLFTRKSKHPENEFNDSDFDHGFKGQEDLSYHYPAVNLNVRSQIRSPYSEDVQHQRPIKDDMYGHSTVQQRQYGRRNVQQPSKSYEGVVV